MTVRHLCCCLVKMLLPQCRQRCLTMDAPLLQRRSLQRLGSSVWHKLRAASKKVPWNSSIYGTPTTTSLKSRYQTDIITTYNYLNYPNTSPTSMTIEDRQPRCCSSSKKVVEHNSNFTRAYARSGGFHDINHPAIGVPPFLLGNLHISNLSYGYPLVNVYKKLLKPWPSRNSFCSHQNHMVDLSIRFFYTFTTQVGSLLPSFIPIHMNNTPLIWSQLMSQWNVENPQTIHHGF